MYYRTALFLFFRIVIDKVADVDILKSGKYSIHFENPSQLKVIYMGCFGLEIFLNRRIPNKNITVAIGT